MSFDNTIKLLKKQDDALIETIHTLDEMQPLKVDSDLWKLREAVDKILNHNDKLLYGAEMELTKIKLISPNYAYVKKGS